jgi:hypothetical protein
MRRGRQRGAIHALVTKPAEPPPESAPMPVVHASSKQPAGTRHDTARSEWTDVLEVVPRTGFEPVYPT